MLTCNPINYQTKPVEYTKILKHDTDKLVIPVMDNEHVNNFIKKCLTVDCTERPTAADLMESDMFIVGKDIFDADEEDVAVKFRKLLDAKHQASMIKIHEMVRCNEQYFGQNKNCCKVETEGIYHEGSKGDGERDKN